MRGCQDTKGKKRQDVKDKTGKVDISREENRKYTRVVRGMARGGEGWEG